MASKHTAFSSSGEDAITRAIEVDVDETADHLSFHEFVEFYEIDRIAEEIVKGDFKRIALQFPDELLHDSVPIYRLLKSKVREDQELYVLADTSYGSCCVDEVAAQHVDADAMVHYGHACMSQTYRLPVFYVFGKLPINVEDCVSRLVEIYNAPVTEAMRARTVLFRHDVAYTWQADIIVAKLRRELDLHGISVSYANIPTKSIPKLSTPLVESQQLSYRGKLDDTIGKADDSKVDTCAILYVGGESLALTNLLVTHAPREVYSYNPKTRTSRMESSRTNKLLMRRYAVVQKARDADVFGILVGTLGVGASSSVGSLTSYLPLIAQIRSSLVRARKKSYTISVGKLNPAKLANFMEIECFVLVACPENSLIEAKEFLRPIITPYELDVALQTEQNWTGRYVLDFEQLLKERKERGENEDSQIVHEDDPDQPIFSLITGKYRHAKRYGEDSSSQDPTDAGPSAVILRNQDGTVSKLADSAAGHFLQSRSYQGLETKVGEDAPSILEQGRSGIARGYQDDHKGNL